MNLIGNGMYALLCDSEQLDALHADPSRVPAASARLEAEKR